MKLLVQLTLFCLSMSAANDSPPNSMNMTTPAGNASEANVTTATTTPAAVATTTPKPDLPASGAAEEEHHSSMTIFFILLIVAISISIVHTLIKLKFHYLPESIAIVLLGVLIGMVLKVLSDARVMDVQSLEAFPPTMFFLVLLPPIIFESGYNLHKGNFFSNIGSILLFAVVGTAVSAGVVGGGIFLLGKADVVYNLSLVESFAFGSLISAVDPVATIAIFNALDIDPQLNMLVFGESILNDAVAIVLTTTVLESGKPTMESYSSGGMFMHALGRFLMMFFLSALIGVFVALATALFLKHVDLRKTPSLELGIMLIAAYIPYGLAEGLHLSGIMAILFCGVVMSHYTHYNLSPMTQLTIQQLFRCLAFMAETCVFAYLGMAIFSFHHVLKPAFIVWSLFLCLVGRAVNIFPLSVIANQFRDHKITKKMQFIMWFSGLRGAIAYALCLHMELDKEETIRVLVSTTLIIVLFTTLIVGGSTMPLLKCMQATSATSRPANRRKKPKEVTLSKTKEMGGLDYSSEHLSEMTEEETDLQMDDYARPKMRGFSKMDILYLKPFFIRKLTQQDFHDAKNQMTTLTNEMYDTLRPTLSHSDSDTEL